MKWFIFLLTAAVAWGAAAQPETAPPPIAPPVLYFAPLPEAPVVVAEVIGTPVAIDLGTSATPGAQNITVPSDAEGAVVFWSYWNSGSGNGLSSISSNFSGTFTTAEIAIGGSSEPATGIAYADVTSTGAKTITPAWDAAPGEGPVFIVAFIKGIDATWTRDTAFDQGVSADDVSVTVDSTADDLVLALDQRYSAGGGPFATGVPPNESGWTSLQTQDNNDEGARLRSADSPGASTTTANGQDEHYSSIAAVSIIAAAAAAAALTPSRIHPMRFLGVR